MAEEVRVVAGRYRVIGLLGTGAQGETWRVHDLHQDEEVALKLINSAPLGPWHEAQALTSLRDDHILPVRNADISAGTPYLVTELARAGTVMDQLDAAGGAGLDPELAVRWSRQTCLALARTHAARLVHTDVKPENLFLDDKGGVRLGDFGFASLLDEDGLGHTSGTPQTMAPEVAEAIVAGRARGTTVRSDVYSAGATLYWMLAGVPPFTRRGSLLAMAPEIARSSPVSLRDVAPHVSRALAQRVDRALQREPARRYGTAGEFAAALGTLPPSSRRWVRSNEHANHVGCWRGQGAGATVLVCAAATAGKITVSATKLPSGRAVRGAGGVATARTLPVVLRKAFAALS